ncbi:MAG: hypothetical protein KIT32_12170 [Rhodocyclaceae bacterium]|nr:hypothetical protein [Rhodocyclaceae bacterium]
MNAIIPKADQIDSTWDNICAVVLAVKDLQERERNLTLQESLMLRDARDALSEVIDDDILQRMRRCFAGESEATRMAMGLPPASAS